MSLLKTNEIQNYNGSSLTLTASTVSTSAQLNTGGNISVTGSLNVSDDSTTRTNLGLGTIATQDSDSITVTGGTATLGALTVSGSDSGDLVRITQTGSGNALVVEDEANPDSTPFVVDSSGRVGIGTSSPSGSSGSLDVAVGRFYLGGASTAISNANILTGGQSGGIQLIGITSGFPTNGQSLGSYAWKSTDSPNGNGSAEAMIEAISAENQSGSSAATDIVFYNKSTGRGPGSSPFERMRIDSSGAITMPAVYSDTVTGRDLYISSSGQLGYVSSIRSSKTNIENLPSIAWLYELTPVKFQYRTKDEDDNYTDEAEPEIQYGFIAEDVVEVNSDLVFGDETENGFELRGIQYSRLIAPMIKAIQEQQALIQSQQSQIDVLSARIEALETT